MTCPDSGLPLTGVKLPGAAISNSLITRSNPSPGVQRLDLRRDVRGGVDQVPAIAVHEAERGHPLPPSGVAPRRGAKRLRAPDVRHAPVLRDPQHDGVNI